MVLAAPAALAGKPKVAMVPFDGDRDNEVGEVVSDALDGDVMVVSFKEVGRTVERLGLEGELSDKDLKKLANELDADAVIQAKLDQKGGNRVLHFKLFVHGKKAKGFKIEFASAKSSKFKQALHDKLVDKIGTTSERDGDDDKPAGKAKTKKKQVAAADDGDDDKPAGKAKTKKKKADADDSGDDDKPAAKAKTKKKKGDADAASADDDKAKTKKKKVDADDASADDDKPKTKAKKPKPDADDGDGDDGQPQAKSKTKKNSDAGDGDDDATPKKKRTARGGDDDDGDARAGGDTLAIRGGARPANRVAVRAEVGPSFASRSLTFNSRPFDQQPKGYKNTAVPGFRFAAELWPLAFAAPSSPAAGLGFAVDFDQTLSLSLQSSAQPGTKFPVTARHYSAAVRYRIPFGDRPTSPSVTFGVGYGARRFFVDRSALMPGNAIDLPDVYYKYVAPGLDVRIPFAPQVAFTFGGRALLVTGAGDIVTAQQYGRAKVTGGDAYAGLEVIIRERFAVRAGAEFALFGFAFTGSGAMTNNRDGDPTSADVGGASDRYLGGVLTFAGLY